MMNDTSKLPISRINELTETLNNLTSNIINVNDKFNRNYNMIKLENGSTLSSSNPEIIKEIVITSKGRPIFLSTCGDANSNNNSSSWFKIYFYRDDSLLCQQTCVSPSASSNNPFSLQYLDIIPSGTYTFKVKYVLGNGIIQFTEENIYAQSPQFIVYEI